MASPSKWTVDNDKYRQPTDITYTSLLGRALFGSMLPLLSSTYGLIKGLVNFLWSPKEYFYYRISQNYKDVKAFSMLAGDSNNFKRLSDNYDKSAKTYSGAMTLSRLFGVAIGIICLLGFFASLAVPLPGITPLYSAGMIAAVKTAGWGCILQAGFWTSFGHVALITSGWTMLGRIGGAFLGSFVDGYKISRVDYETQQRVIQGKVFLTERAPSTNCIFKRLMTNTATIGICGEAGIHVADKIFKKKPKTIYPPSRAITEHDEYPKNSYEFRRYES